MHVLGSDVDFDGHVNYRRMHDSDSIQSDDLNYSSDGTEHSEVEDESLLNTSSKLSLNECVSNEVLSKQRIIVQNFYNVIPAKFNRSVYTPFDLIYLKYSNRFVNIFWSDVQSRQLKN